jgi:hypothetical protein
MFMTYLVIGRRRDHGKPKGSGAGNRRKRLLQSMTTVAVHRLSFPGWAQREAKPDYSATMTILRHARGVEDWPVRKWYHASAAVI